MKNDYKIRFNDLFFTNLVLGTISFYCKQIRISVTKLPSSVQKTVLFYLNHLFLSKLTVFLINRKFFYVEILKLTFGLIQLS